MMSRTMTSGISCDRTFGPKVSVPAIGMKSTPEVAVSLMAS